MVGYAEKRKLGEKPREGIRNRRRSAAWYDDLAANGLVEGEPGARIIGTPLGRRAVVDYEFPDPDTMRQRFPELWQPLEDRLRAAGVDSHVTCDLEDPRNRRWIEPVLFGQLFEPPRRDYVVLERKNPLPEGVPPGMPEGYASRPARGGDETALLPVVSEAFAEEEPTVESLARELADADWAMVAERESQPVGLCLMGDTDGLAWVDSLAVLADHRGKGIGEALLVAGLAWARDNRPGPVRVYTDFWRAEAMGLYRKFGFTQAYTGVQFRRPMDPAEIQEILSRRKNTYSRWVGFR